MRKEKDLLVVGNLAKDIIFGETKFGGCAASIAINAQRIGLATGVMSVLGEDDFSGSFRRMLDGYGIDTRLVKTGIQSIPVCEVTSTVNSIASSTWADNGCNAAMERFVFGRQDLEDYAMIHLVCCPPLLAENISTIPGIRLSYEPGPMVTVNKDYFSPRVLGRSELLFLNQEEQATVMETQGYKSVVELFGEQTKTVILTRGKDGADIISMFDDKTHTYHVNAAPAKTIVDCTGAGDSFKAGFLSAYLQGMNINQAAEVGCLAGALAVSQKGGVLTDDSILLIRKSICT